ncbi:MAG TPA: NADP oxidoreductase [bacterium]|nr:NADP oxidoreductase [bacterium]HQL63344.1 NADP oxidoreductase [bacterium]
MRKIRLATVWLDGCSGCHMSLLDVDERIIEFANRIEVLYSPLVDRKEFPDSVDLTLVEGAIASDEDLHRIHLIRERSKVLVALGDCAVTGNISGMRNSYPVNAVLQRAYAENAGTRNGLPQRGLPVLLQRCRPLHEVVPVDLHVPGCPPRADLIYAVLKAILEGHLPQNIHTRFG